MQNDLHKIKHSTKKFKSAEIFKKMQKMQLIEKYCLKKAKKILYNENRDKKKLQSQNR